jgi:hypothetical protein
LLVGATSNAMLLRYLALEVLFVDSLDHRNKVRNE